MECSNVFYAGMMVATIALVSPAAAATTLNVANYGVDSGACGPVLGTPCRSISQAITNAMAGDTILVGPGRYGDLDGNGSLGGTGEESGATGMIDVNKTLIILSTMGASATVVDYGLVSAGFYVTAPDVVIGSVNKGFTISGDSGAGINLTGTASGATVAGNFVSAVQVPGTFPIYMNAPSAVARDNRARGGFGALLTKAGAVAERNVLSGALFGLYAVTADGATLQKNVAVDNDYGSYVSSTSAPPAVFTRNLLTGNHLGGLYVLQLTTPPALTDVATGNNFYGNGDYASASPSNCGLIVENNDGTNALAVTADGNYWGDVAPGPNPADNAAGPCNVTGGGVENVTTASPAAAEFKILPKALR